MTKRNAPKNLKARGKRIWVDLIGAMNDEAQVAVLEEFCRMADRLNELDDQIRGVPQMVRLVVDDAERDGDIVVHVHVDKALAEARQQQATFKALVREVRDALTESSKGSASEPSKPDTAAMSPLERVLAEGRTAEAR